MGARYRCYSRLCSAKFATFKQCQAHAWDRHRSTLEIKYWGKRQPRAMAVQELTIWGTGVSTITTRNTDGMVKCLYHNNCFFGSRMEAQDHIENYEDEMRVMQLLNSGLGWDEKDESEVSGWTYAIDWADAVQ